jgi:hypothetical protein
MAFFLRSLATFLCGLTILVTAGRASAWVETAIVSDAITLDVESSGQATVHHELVIRLRGGPLKGTELDGVDFDAMPVEGATVTKVGDASAEAKPLLLTRGDDDTLRLEIDDEKGLRSGTYSFRFGYRTDLRQRSRIETRGSWAELAWVGPRYAVGLDVAKVTFRLPYAPTAPRLPEIDANDDESSAAGPSAMLSNLRRNGATDELELIRPHVAKGEPVLWKAWVAPESFSWLKAGAESGPSQVHSRSLPKRSPWVKALPLILAGLFACLVGALVWFKSQAVAALDRRHGQASAPLVRLGATWRAVLAAACAAIALVTAVRFESPTSGAIALLFAMLLSTYRRPTATRSLRGPGRWLLLSDTEAWQKVPVGECNRWLDASRPKGMAVLFGWYVMALVLFGACLVREPYYAWLILLASLVVLPSFVTACYSETPIAKAESSRQLLRSLWARLRRNRRLKVSIVGRFAEGQAEPDELRLRVSGPGSLDGLMAVELATSSNGPLTSPELSLLVRVREGSPAQSEYSRSLVFGRGRTELERVAVMSPAVASRGQLLRWIAELTDGVRREPPESAHGANSRKSADKSSGKGSSTEKPGRSGSPTHATRAA